MSITTTNITITFLLIQLVICFIAYSIGRISHIIGGKWNTPHHWIYGYILIAIGAFNYKNTFGISTISFGIGLVISDWDDFLKAKYFGRDEHEKFVFWGFD